jgi:hypothetical protein
MNDGYKILNIDILRFFMLTSIILSNDDYKWTKNILEIDKTHSKVYS